MPSTLVEFIKKDEIVEEELEEFEREEIVDMNFLILKKKFPSFIILLSLSFIMIIRKEKKNPIKIEKNIENKTS
jgi:hypothetical protein